MLHRPNVAIKSLFLTSYSLRHFWSFLEWNKKVIPKKEYITTKRVPFFPGKRRWDALIGSEVWKFPILFMVVYLWCNIYHRHKYDITYDVMFLACSHTYLFLFVIVINHLRGLFVVNKPWYPRAEPEWRMLINRKQTEWLLNNNYIIAGNLSGQIYLLLIYLSHLVAIFPSFFF